MEMNETQPPPGYEWAGGALVMNGPRDVRRPGAPTMMSLAAAWREHRQATPPDIGVGDTDRFARENPPATDHTDADRRRSEMVRFIVDRYGRQRQLRVPVTEVSNRLDISRRTVAAWREPDALARALPLRPVDFLERLVCLLAPPPPGAAPALPTAIRFRQVGGQRQLELRAVHSVIVQLADWIAGTGLRLQVEAGHARMVVRGSAASLRYLRRRILALERWQTLTPNPEDVDVWLAAGVAC